MTSVVVAIVTYGSRASLLGETIRRSIAAGAIRVIVVLNGASDESRRTAESFGDLVLISILPDNSGSAGGFGEAIRLAKSLDTNVLLLDDDNWIEHDAIHLLLKASLKVASHRSATVALAALHRANPPQLAASRGIPASAVYPILERGSIEGFDLLQRFTGRFLRRDVQTVVQLDAHPPIPVAPYGGLFLTREGLRIAPMPNPSMVLYNDDYEFTWRLAREGVQLFLCPEVEIEEADGKQTTPPPNISYLVRVLRTPSSERWRVLYRLRNAAYLYRRVAAVEGASVRFGFNLMVRTGLLAALGVIDRRPAFAIELIRAHWRGARGRLGPSYPLPGRNYNLPPSEIDAI